MPASTGHPDDSDDMDVEYVEYDGEFDDGTAPFFALPPYPSEIAPPHIPNVATSLTLEVPPIPLQVLHLQARATRDTPLPPYLGATIRGALGAALRKLSCTTGAPNCHGCPRAPDCAYGVVWEGAGAHSLGDLARGSDAPRPYVLAWERVARRGDRIARGSPLRFKLTLFGQGREHLPTLILAIRDALATGLGAEKSPLRLERVYVANAHDRYDAPSGRALVLYEDDQLRHFSALPEPTLWALAHTQAAALGSRFRMYFATPLALTGGGQRADIITPPLLVQRLAERIERLRRAWAPDVHTPPLDWESLVELANAIRVLRVDTWLHRFERHSRRAGPVPMEGVLGLVDLAEVPPQIARLLAAGTWTHVGKQATFGFGRLALAAPANRTREV
jgi:hypothetical protein